MVIQNVKKEIYNILSNQLGYTVVDTPTQSKPNFPWLRISTVNLTRKPYGNNAFEYLMKISIDIFSDYDGELEILQIEQNIFNNINQLYSIDGVSRVSGSTLHLFDDKSTGVLIKRGSIVYDITLAGEENVNE